MPYRLIKINEELIEETAEIAADIFISHFTPIIGETQSRYMVERFLSPKAIKEELTKGTIFKLVKDEDQNIGFTEYKAEGERIFLSKLYVRKDYRGKGVGSLMLKDVIAYACEQDKKAIYLTVNKHNDLTINIYLHWDFKIIDAVVNDIGNGYVMDDYIMEKIL